MQMAQDITMSKAVKLIFKNKLGIIVGEVELVEGTGAPDAKAIDIHDAFSMNFIDSDGKEVSGIYFK
jgi:hypothetical protein